MKKPISWKNIRWAIFFAVLILIMIGAAFPTGGETVQGAQVVSFLHMQGIAQGLQAFSIDHGGALPDRLAELFPNYICDPQPFFPNRKFAHSFTPGDAATHPETIDVFSPYGYLKARDGRVVVVERPGLWGDGKISYLVLGKDGYPVGSSSLCHVRPEEFVRRLRLNFPDQPGAGYTRTTTCQIGVHTYTIEIDGAEMERKQTAFKASGRPPITAEAALAKARAALEALEPGGSWEVKPGILTSDGTTPFYRFECEYLRNGAETGHVEVLVLMEGTVIAPRFQQQPPPEPNSARCRTFNAEEGPIGLRQLALHYMSR